MKQKFDALTDLVEQTQDAQPTEPSPSSSERQVENAQGELITLDDKTRPEIF